MASGLLPSQGQKWLLLLFWGVVAGFVVVVVVGWGGGGGEGGCVFSSGGSLNGPMPSNVMDFGRVLLFSLHALTTT